MKSSAVPAQSNLVEDVASSVPINSTKARRLKKIEAAIKAELPRAMEGFKKALPHAIRVGELLIEAKDSDLLDHGEWSSWLDTHINIKRRAAQGYMRLARWRKAHPNASLDEGINAMLRRIGRRAKKVVVARKIPASSHRIEYVPVEEVLKLMPHPLNYKTHPPEQIEHLIRSIIEVGVLRPIIVARDGTILSGHGIVEALRELNRRREAAESASRQPEADEREPCAGDGC